MKNKAINKNDEIDLVELAKLLWSKRVKIVKITLVFIALGVITALTSKVQYSAYCKLLPESQEGAVPDLGGLGGLAGLAGINLSGFGSDGVLTPEMYPEIVSSTPFLVELINESVYFENRDTTISSYNYFKYLDSPTLFGYILEYTIGLPSKIKKSFSPSEGSPKNYQMLRFSKEDWKLIEKFSEKLLVSVDPKTGTISIETEMPDPVAAAKMTSLLVENLTRKIIKYKIEKASINLKFIEERFNESKVEYEGRQKELARFTDRNRNITNSIFQTELSHLQNEVDISFEVYKSLATQLEQAKIKVKEETPVFSVLEPVKIPEDKSKPKRGIMVVLFMIVGLMTASGFIIVKFYLGVE